MCRDDDTTNQLPVDMWSFRGSQLHSWLIFCTSGLRFGLSRALPTRRRAKRQALVDFSDSLWTA